MKEKPDTQKTMEEEFITILRRMFEDLYHLDLSNQKYRKFVEKQQKLAEYFLSAGRIWERPTPYKNNKHKKKKTNK